MDARFPRLSMDGFETDEQKNMRVLHAKAEALKAADFLKSWYGVEEVYLFGSLLDTAAFSAHSDIDLAIRGMPISAYFHANGKLLDVIEGFDFDLVDLDACKPAVLESIMRTGVKL